MNYANLDALVADIENFTEKPLDNQMNDSSRTTVTGMEWFKYSGKTVNYILPDGDGRV